MAPDLVRYVVSADPHAPSRFRAIGAPSNLPEFAEAFSCRPGQPMVRGPEERISIW
jgi:putative endopeptidase